MSSLRNSLRPLNWEMSMCGCPIFSYKHKFVNFLLTLHGLILITFLLTLVFSETTNIGVKSDSPTIVRFMMLIWNLAAFGFAVVFTLIVWKSRIAIRLLLEEISSYLTLHDYYKIHRFTSKLFIHRLLYCIIIRIPYITFFFWDGYCNKHWTGVNVMQVIFVYYQVQDAHLGTLSLYLTLLKILDLCETRIIQGLKKNIKNLQPRDVHFMIKKCLYFKDKVSNSVSILVCFMFGNLFIYAVCNLCRFQLVFFDDEISIPIKIWTLLSLIRLLIYCLQAMFLVFMTHKLSCNFQKNLSSLEDTIVQSDDTRDWTSVLLVINVAQGYKYRAFDFFEIDRNLLLSFALSFVSLTVLFTQLINQAIR